MSRSNPIPDPPRPPIPAPTAPSKRPTALDELLANADAARPTQLANAQEVARKHGGDLRWNVDRGEYIVWDGRVWKSDRDGQVNRWCKSVARGTQHRLAQVGVEPKEATKHARWMESHFGIAGVMQLLRSEPGVTVLASELDSDRMLLNFTNGTLDLRANGTPPKLREHRREDLITRILPFNFNPDAKCPLWDSSLSTMMRGNADLLGYLQRIIGLALTSDISVQELFIFHGGGANGKSVVVDTILGMLGDYAGTAPDSLLIIRSNQEHPTELADLLGKRLVVASETEQGGKLRLQLVKKLTGDVRIKARFMRQDFFEFDRTHKLILVTNNKPTIAENSEAAWRRIRLMPFTVTIPKEKRDPKLTEKLRPEWPGIMAWAVRGCLDWQRSGMQPPAEVLAATAAYQSDADMLADYVNARIAVDSEARVTRAELWSDYQSWAVQSGEKEKLDRNTLFDRIRRVENVVDWQWRYAGAPVRGFVGIRLSAATAATPSGEDLTEDENGY